LNRLTLQPQRSVCDIINYLSQKFLSFLNADTNRPPGVFRLYPPVGGGRARRTGTREEYGWGEDEAIPIDAILQFMKCPVPFYLEFEYHESPPAFFLQGPLSTFPPVKVDPGPAVAAILSNMAVSPESSGYGAKAENNGANNMMKNPFNNNDMDTTYHGNDKAHKDAEKRKREHRRERKEGAQEEEASSMEMEAQRQFKQARRDHSNFDASKQTTLLMDSLFIDEDKRGSPTLVTSDDQYSETAEFQRPEFL